MMPKTIKCYHSIQSAFSLAWRPPCNISAGKVSIAGHMRFAVLTSMMRRVEDLSFSHVCCSTSAESECRFRIINTNMNGKVEEHGLVTE